MLNNEINKDTHNTIESPSTPDMFADSPLEKAPQDTNQSHKENVFDHGDNEGYYSHKKGEIINDRYEILGICGKGIFSTVVKVLDLTKKIEVALKIIRSIEIMTLSGEKERNILKKLNDEDKNGKTYL